jgi:hydroxymethylglutaryl-CoA lyase
MNKELIQIQEVGPRDGLQNESVILDTLSKIKLIEMLADAGLKRIESSSFVSPKYVPQLGDSEEVTKAITGKRSDVIYTSLVPNVKGAQRAFLSGAKDLTVFVSASESHNRANVNMSISESMAQLEKVAEKVDELRGTLRGYIVTSFGCPYQGEVPEETVIKICDRYVEMGVSEISLGDTTGMANPEQVKRLVDKMLARLGGKARLAVHFHDTRGMALANVYAAFTSGVRIFDSAIGGIGGCPFAPGATGNVATEDIVHMFTCMGYDTGVNFEKLLEANYFLQEILGKKLPSYLGKVSPVWENTINKIK